MQTTCKNKANQEKKLNLTNQRGNKETAGLMMDFGKKVRHTKPHSQRGREFTSQPVM